MPLIATKSSGGTSNPCPAGNHAAVCVRVIDLGTQKQMKGQWAGKISPQIMISWETPEETHVFDESKGPEPFMLSGEYMLSLSEKANLRKILESWRGKKFTESELEGFDISKLLGAKCLINVVHATKDQKTYANVASVSPLPKGMNCPDAKSEKLVYEIDNGKDAVYQKLPEWIRKKIDACENWKEGFSTPPSSEEEAQNSSADEEVSSGKEPFPF